MQQANSQVQRLALCTGHNYLRDSSIRQAGENEDCLCTPGQRPLQRRNLTTSYLNICKWTVQFQTAVLKQKALGRAQNREVDPGQLRVSQEVSSEFKTSPKTINCEQVCLCPPPWSAKLRTFCLGYARLTLRFLSCILREVLEQFNSPGRSPP